MDELNHLLEDIKHYCISNSIKVFHGSFSEKQLTIVRWKDFYGLGWKEFMKQLNLQDNCDVLIINMHEYSINKFIDIEYLETKISNDVKMKLVEVIDDLTIHEGHYYYINVSLIKGSVCYQFNQNANWADQIKYLIDLKNELDNIEHDDVNSINSAFKSLSKDEVDGFVERILKNQDFLISAHAHQRKSIILEMLEEVLHAETINQFIINPAELALEKYFREKVGQLKKIGKTKTEICAELNMSADRIKKYYY